MNDKISTRIKIFTESDKKALERTVSEFIDRLDDNEKPSLQFSTSLEPSQGMMREKMFYSVMVTITTTWL